jgi:RimJ/RimL family protein N-acetyltransferase
MIRLVGSETAKERSLLTVRLETPRLFMRPLAGSDAPVIADHLSDPEVTRWLARVPHPYRLADAVGFVEQARLAAAAGTASTLALVSRDEPILPIGVAVIHGITAEPEFGYWLARDHWGMGLMSEAAAAMLRHARDDVGLGRIRSGAFVGNQRKIGFVVTGTSHRLCLAEGRMKEHVDTVVDVGDLPAGV